MYDNGSAKLHQMAAVLRANEDQTKIAASKRLYQEHEAPLVGHQLLKWEREAPLRMLAALT